MRKFKEALISAAEGDRSSVVLSFLLLLGNVYVSHQYWANEKMALVLAHLRISCALHIILLTGLRWALFPLLVLPSEKSFPTMFTGLLSAFQMVLVLMDLGYNRRVFFYLNRFDQTVKLLIYLTFFINLFFILGFYVLLIVQLIYSKVKGRDITFSSIENLKEKLINEIDLVNVSPNMRPLRRGEIRALESIDLESQSDVRNCYICLLEIVKESKVVKSENCEHLFHSCCIKAWLAVKSTCPMCRCNFRKI